MNLQLFFSLAGREARGQRGKLFFLTLCLAVGVCAIVAVAALVEGIRSGAARQSRELLGADIVVESRRPLPDELDAAVAQLDEARRSDLLELPTMVASEAGKARLVELIVLDGPWPLYGDFRIASGRTPGEILASGELLAERGLLEDLGVAVGDEVLLGGQKLKIGDRVTVSPEKSGFSFVLGPRAYVSRESFDRTGLLKFGSRLKYKALIGLGENDQDRATAISERWASELPGGDWLTLRSHEQAQERLARPLRDVESFLGLVALLSLVLGGIGVARIVRAWIDSRARGIAVMRCMGMRPIEVAWIYLGQIVVLALLGSLLGGCVGILVPELVAAVAGDYLPPDLLDPWQPSALLEGLIVGPLIALLFSVPALAALWQVSPARVFRATAEALPVPRRAAFACWSLVAIGLFGAAWRLGDDPLVALVFVAFLGVALGLLAGSALLLRFLLARLPRARIEPHLRHGLAALTRPSAGVQGGLVALGLGALVVSTIVLVEDRLAQGLEKALPEAAPSAFFIDVQPDQWEVLRAELERRGAEAVDSAPVVMARLVSVDGKGIAELAEEPRPEGSREGRRGWVLKREQRITWLEGFDASNSITSGSSFADDEVAEISIEEDFARDLNAKVGSTLVFDVQGLEMSFLVSSLRTVDWASFRINFFLVAEPGVLDEAPHFRIATARLDPAAEESLEGDLARLLPNVTMIRVRGVLEKVAAILEGLLYGIGALGSFTVIAGLGILAGSVSSASLRRSRETALLKVLGVRPRGVIVLLVAEFGLLGAVAGLLGSAGGLALTWLVGQQLELEGSLNPLLAFWVLCGVALLTVLAGAVAAGRSLRARPRLVLAGD